MQFTLPQAMNTNYIDEYQYMAANTEDFVEIHQEAINALPPNERKILEDALQIVTDFAEESFAQGYVEM